MIKLQPLFFLILLICAGQLVAQERGQYLPGFKGMNAADQPPPGITYANYFIWYPSSKLKDRDGKKAAVNFDLDIVGDVNYLAYTSKKKVLGATYSASVAVPLLNTAVTIPRLGGGSGGGIGDIYVEPLSLGWAFKKGKARVAYGVTAPTGVDSTTSDYWGHQLSAGGSYNPGKTGLWQVNLSSVWEFHHKKGHQDVKVGNNVTFEYSVGRTFVKNKGAQLYQVGLTGYSQYQLTNDSGTGVSAFNIGAKDRVHAIGPEFAVILPAKKFSFLVRVLPEYGARSRTQGVTVLVGVGKSF